ncbi:MAG: trypsin-like serine protease, partial [Mariniblastus sp.]
PAAGKVATESMSGVDGVRKEREQRNLNNFITTVVIGLGLLLVIGALVTMLILQLKKVDQLADEPSPTIPGPVEKVEPKIERPDEDLPDSKLVTAPADKPTRKFKLKFDDLPPQKFAYLKKREVNDAWSVIQPYLVNLKVHDARGSHLAVGTIVDTRGWILTSYQTVAGASKIEVTQSAKSIDEVSDDLLTDQVRGVIGIDKKNDLALLSINRRFVISFADVAFADSNTVVETGYFVQCAPPTATNPYARHEAKISVRGGVGDLSDDAQSKAIQAKLGKPVAILGGGDTDEEDNGIDDWPLTWVVASSPKQPLPGTPLVNIDGELAAMNVFSDSREAQYLLVDNVFELIANSADKVQPISVLGGITSDSILVAVPDDHEFREPSVGLNQAGEACKEFNWIPDSQQQYETLQKFAKHFAELKKVSIENLESDDQVDQIISKQVTAWENSLTKRFVEIIESSSNEGDRKKLQEMNRRFATPAIESGGQMVPFFGQVDSAGIIGERMILNLYGDDTSVSVPFVERESPMRLESEWLIFVTTPATPKRVVFTAPNGQKIACFTVFDMLNFGLDL